VDEPPYDRSPGRWSGNIDFSGKKHHHAPATIAQEDATLVTA
jgi:hypothetical protein